MFHAEQQAAPRRKPDCPGAGDAVRMTPRTEESPWFLCGGGYRHGETQAGPWPRRSAGDRGKRHRHRPLVVRVKDGKYQLVAGERRLRAAQEVGLTSVPVRVVNFNDQEILEAALIENIQRTDLNPIEKAQGFKDYLERFGMTHEELAKRIGLARATITNLVNLLELAHEVQEAVRVNQISEGHAKLLKGVKDQQQQLALCRQIIAQGLSVKAAETFLREQREEKPATDPDGKGGAVAEPEEKTAHVRSIEDELRQKLSTKVEIKVRGKDKGQIVLRFETNDDFMRLLEVLRR